MKSNREKTNVDPYCEFCAGEGAERRVAEDEVLEMIWKVSERGHATLADAVGAVGNEEIVCKMRNDGLISIDNGRVSFTEAGRRRARDVTRRHLLAERLLMDVLGMQEYEIDACRFEHAISAEVEEAICTLLGHPPTCPHGRPIPSGRCCDQQKRDLKPLVQPLTEVEVGTIGKVSFITARPIDRLASMGLVPGTLLKLHQKRPSYVIVVGQTTIAIDDEIARGIFVKRM